MKTRIYFLDNLRTFLIFLVVLLHAGMSYSLGMDSFWIVIDLHTWKSLALVNMYLDLFVMFIMFFISGYFIPASIRNRRGLDFIKSKFKRIITPWIIAVFNLVPAYKAIFLYSRGLPQEEWFSYFHLFQRSGTDLSFYANNPTQSWLWFLPVLFLFQVLYYGLSKTELFNIKMTLKVGVILTFIVGLIYSMVISNAGLKGWFHSPLFDFQRERLLIYFMSFLLGTLCYKLKIFESEKKPIKFYVFSNVVLMLSLGVFTAIALNLFFNMVAPGRNHFFISEFIDRLGYYLSALLSSLSFLYVIIYLFRFNFNKSNMLMRQLNRNSYEVYIIHMIVLGLIALIILPIDMQGYIKFMILTLLTFVMSNIIVYAYQRWFQKNTALKTATFAVLVSALFAFIHFGDKQLASNSGSQRNLSTAVKPPYMGLHQAVIQGNLVAVRQYISRDWALNEKDASSGSSPLITAAAFGKTEIALALIEAGADVDLRNDEGSTPLHAAAFFCRPIIVKTLLEKGADTTIKNNAGTTALETVTGRFEAVKDIYDNFDRLFSPMGVTLDYEQIKATRPVIVEMLQNQTP